MKIFTVPDVVSNGYITLATVGLGTHVNASLLSGAYAGNCVRESLLEEAEMIVLASMSHACVNKKAERVSFCNDKYHACVAFHENCIVELTVTDKETDEHSFLSPFPDEGAGKLPK